MREVAELTGSSARVTAVLADTYRGSWIHAPGAMFADLVAAVADGADRVDGSLSCGIPSTCSGRSPRRRHCGDWLMSHRRWSLPAI